VAAAPSHTGLGRLQRFVGFRGWGVGASVDQLALLLRILTAGPHLVAALVLFFAQQRLC
jgi:hypothetical protein